MTSEISVEPLFSHFEVIVTLWDKIGGRTYELNFVRSQKYTRADQILRAYSKRALPVTEVDS